MAKERQGLTATVAKVNGDSWQLVACCQHFASNNNNQKLRR